MLLTRSIYAESEPTRSLRPGERVIGEGYALGLLTEWVIGREVVTRRDILRLMDVVIASGMFPPATRAFRHERRRKRVGGARHCGRTAKRRR
jgi:hypothetical protein